MSLEPATDLVVLSPAIMLLLAALAALALDWFRTDRTGRVSAGIGLVGIAAAAGLALRVWPATGRIAFARLVEPGGAVLGALRLDAFASFVTWTVLVSTAAAIAIGLGYTARRGFAQAEYHALLLTAAAGMIVLAMANDLVLVFLLIETFSLALYVLSGFAREDRGGLEAAVKYFVLGAVAAGLLLYGTALVYAAVGSTHLETVAAALRGEATGPSPVLLAGFALLLVGLGFKAALVPFHQWTPDVYEGAPLPVVAFMSAATKAAAFAALARILWVGFAPLSGSWEGPIAALAVVTMIGGNLGALVQGDVKRMLGYSSVAQSGYVLAALVAGTSLGVAAALYYVLVLALTSLGAFAVLVAIGPLGSSGRDATSLDDLRGLSVRHAGLALAMSVFLVTLIGLPPSAGFLGKWLIFNALAERGMYWLAVAVVLNSVLSAFFYARPILYMYASRGEPSDRIEAATAPAVVVATTALVVALAAVLSAPLIDGAMASGSLGAVEASTITEGDEIPLYFAPPAFEKVPRQAP